MRARVTIAASKDGRCMGVTILAFVDGDLLSFVVTSDRLGVMRTFSVVIVAGLAVSHDFYATLHRIRAPLSKLEHSSNITPPLVLPLSTSRLLSWSSFWHVVG
jgi:glycine/D-amino acid oxidase-like deaminating enzyme